MGAYYFIDRNPKPETAEEKAEWKKLWAEVEAVLERMKDKKI